MKNGPPLSSLMRRIAETPGEFMQDPLMKNKPKKSGGINVTAVVSDLLFDSGGNFLSPGDRTRFQLSYSEENRNYLQVVLILCHLYHDDWFLKEKLGGPILKFFLSKKLKNLSMIVKPGLFINDQERREELARLALFELDLIPEGESEEGALDRLMTLDSIEKKRIIEKSREAQERARKLREALVQKEAEEAASKMSRE